MPAGLPAAHDADPVGTGTRGDAARAKALLTEAGMTAPVPFTVAYRSTPTADKAMAALVAGWRLAGFEPTTRPITDDYFTAISDPKLADRGRRVLVELGARVGLGLDDPAAAVRQLDQHHQGRPGTRLRLLERPRRSTPGWPRSRRSPTAPPARRPGPRSTQSLLARGAYIGLAERRALYIAGSDVRNLSANTVDGGVVEFADIAVVQ